MGFPIAAAEAQNPVMQDALTTGVANSLGLEPESVTIISVGGVAVSRRRLANIGIEFQILSNSNVGSAVAQLQEGLETAATEGAVVANVQKAASDKGVFVQALKTCHFRFQNQQWGKLKLKLKLRSKWQYFPPFPYERPNDEHHTKTNLYSFEWCGS